MKKKPKPKPMTTIARVKAFEIQTALTDLRTYEHADQLKQLNQWFNELRNQIDSRFTGMDREKIRVDVNEKLVDGIHLQLGIINQRLAALEHLSGIRCNVPAEPTPGWQKIVTLGTIIIPKPSLWQKFKRFLGF